MLDQKTMKNKPLLRLGIVIIIISFCSCNKNDEETTYFKFSKNGESVKYPVYSAYSDFDNHTYIRAGYLDNISNTENDELFQLLILNEYKDYYNLQDTIVVWYTEVGSTDYFFAPKIYFDFSMENPYPDSAFIDKETTEFNLTFNEFDKTSGFISGNFNGILRNRYYDLTDSIIITNGKFRINSVLND